MIQPEGFEIPGKKEIVCRLKKSLYGLKKDPKQWFEKFDGVLRSNGLEVNFSNTCLYSKKHALGCVTLCLYVDDMLICGPNLELITETKSMLSSNFEIKD